MKVSISLPAEDVEFLDAYVKERGITSRSGAVHKAVRLLRAAELGDAYDGAWQESAANGDGDAWDSTAADGLPS